MAGVIVRQAEGSLRAARAAWKDAVRPSTVRHYSRAYKGGSNWGCAVYSSRASGYGIWRPRPLARQYSGTADPAHPDSAYRLAYNAGYGLGMAASEGKVVIVGVTGASGAILAQTALRLLAADARVARVHLVVTDAGRRILDHEFGIGAPSRICLRAMVGGSVGF